MSDDIESIASSVFPTWTTCKIIILFRWKCWTAAAVVPRSFDPRCQRKSVRIEYLWGWLSLMSLASPLNCSWTCVNRFCRIPVINASSVLSIAERYLHVFVCWKALRIGNRASRASAAMKFSACYAEIRYIAAVGKWKPKTVKLSGFSSCVGCIHIVCRNRYRERAETGSDLTCRS